MMREEMQTKPKFDAGEARRALAAKAQEMMSSGEVLCYSELYAVLSHEITMLSVAIGQPTGYVAMCLVDDLEAGLD